jgi:hypothetical protein
MYTFFSKKGQRRIEVTRSNLGEIDLELHQVIASGEQTLKSNAIYRVINKNKANHSTFSWSTF